MKTLTAILITGSLLIALPVWAQGNDYTDRSSIPNACELFAQDAWQAADNLSQGVALPQLLSLLETAPVSDNEKERAFQAIQFVWGHQLDNPVLAYTLAMGLCLKPKHEMAPMDEPWITSPRTISGYF